MKPISHPPPRAVNRYEDRNEYFVWENGRYVKVRTEFKK
jgi:hypothetical protein